MLHLSSQMRGEIISIMEAFMTLTFLIITVTDGDINTVHPVFESRFMLGPKTFSTLRCRVLGGLTIVNVHILKRGLG